MAVSNSVLIGAVVAAAIVAGAGAYFLSGDSAPAPAEIAAAPAAPAPAAPAPAPAAPPPAPAATPPAAPAPAPAAPAPGGMAAAPAPATPPADAPSGTPGGNSGKGSGVPGLPGMSPGGSGGTSPGGTAPGAGTTPGAGLPGMPGGGAPGGMPGGGMPPGGGAAGNLQQAIVGTWQGQVMTEGIAQVTQSTFGADGTFTQQTRLPQLSNQILSIQGTWKVIDDGRGGQAIELTPTSWDPQQVCAFNGQCQPFEPTTETVPVRLMNQNMMQVPGGMFQRVG